MKNNKPTAREKATPQLRHQANAVTTAPAYLGQFVLQVRRGLLDLRPSRPAARLARIAVGIEALIGPVERIVKAAQETGA